MSAYFTGAIKQTIFDKDLKLSFPVLIHYPTNTPSSPTTVGPYIMDVATDAPIAEGYFPLVILSHGNGGSHLIYSTISTYLAKNGYIVMLPEHYGNNRNDNHLENTEMNLKLRPAHIILCIDFIFSNSKFNASINKNNIAVIGHSMGGYAALAVAGGEARTIDGQLIKTSSDTRVKALVLLAPGAGWFKYGLQKVTAPILLFSAEQDNITPSWNAEIILESVPDPQKVTHEVVKNAGHFSFLSPFPEILKKPGFLPAHDPVGFDRIKFHQKLPLKIESFLRLHLNTKT